MKTRLEQLNPDKSQTNRKPTREELILSGLEIESAAAMILEQDVYLLQDHYDVEAKSGVTGINELDLFLKYGLTVAGKPFHLVVHNIDLADEAMQADFFSMAKDRCIHTYHDMLENIVIVFTISSIDRKKNVLYNLRNYCADLSVIES